LNYLKAKMGVLFVVLLCSSLEAIKRKERRLTIKEDKVMSNKGLKCAENRNTQWASVRDGQLP
jgi:hypothetical protein